MSGDLDELLAELELVAAQLATSHRELGMLLSAEKNAKVLGFNQSDARSVSERENVGSVQALNITEDIFKLRATINALEARRDYLTVAIPVEIQRTLVPVPVAV
jgi:hypothetical protein